MVAFRVGSLVWTSRQGQRGGSRYRKTGPLQCANDVSDVQTQSGIHQVTGTNGDIKKSCHTGEGRCPWQKWIPAFAGKALHQPGFDFHARRGRPRRYSIHINGPWCITFEWREGRALRVDLEQYH
jgi:hypothetical protein